MTPTLALVFGIGMAELLIILFMLGVFAFWIWMIIDCATNEEGGSKIAWILILVLLGIVGAPMYFFARKLSRKIKSS